MPALEAVPLPVRTRRVRLERPTAQHLDELVALLNDPLVSRWLLHVPHPYTRDAGRQFLARSARWRRHGTDLALWVIERSTGHLVGGVGLHQLSHVHRRAEVGYWIGRPFWGRGLATEAVGRAVSLAFNTLHLDRLDAATFGGNRRSGHVLRKLGFRYEGRRRHSFYVQGRWVDDVLYGRLRPLGRVARRRSGGRRLR